MKKLSFFMLLAAFACSKPESIEPTPTPIFTDLTPSAYISKFKSLGSEATMVDVRSESEYQEGHRSEAIQIDINASDFNTKAEKLLKKNKAIFVYCRSGSRSRVAAQRLQSLNFLIIYNLSGGFNDIKDL